MSIQVTGIIEGPLGTPSPGITIRVVSKISYRDTYRLSTEDHTTTAGGAYDFQLNEGFHKILIRYRGASSFTKLGDVSVSDQTPSPITLINLLESSSPKALVVKLQELADEASESAQSASDDADQVALDKQQVTLLAQQVSDDADQVALDKSATAQSEANAAQSAVNSEQSYQNTLLVVPGLQTQITNNESNIQDLIDGQQSGVLVFQTYALLDAYTPANATEERCSFKVTNDGNTSLNGYYSWVSGTDYIKNSDLVVNKIEDDNTSDAISGAAARRYTQVDNIKSITPNLLDEPNSLEGFYVEVTGAVIANSSYRASDYIKIESGVTYNLYRDSGGLISGRARKTCYYDINYNVVAGGDSSTVSTFTPPPGAKYVRISTYQEDYDAGENTTLVKALDYPSPVIFPYYARTEKNESVATKVYGATVENESSDPKAVLSKETIEAYTDSSILTSVSSDSTWFNYTENGTYAGGDAEARSGSSGVDLTSQNDLIARGFSRAMQWRSGNEYVRSQYGGNITGKYITGGFLCYSENPLNLDLDAFVYSENSGGTLDNTSSQYVNKISITENLVLVYRQSLVTQADAVNALVGSTSAPDDNTRYATGFVAFITETPIQEIDLIKYFTTNDIARFSAKEIADAEIGKINEKAYRGSVEFGGPDAITRIVGSKYTREVLPFKNVEILDSRVFNFDTDYIGSIPIREDTRDDVAPIHAFGTTLMANHSYFGCRYTSPSHGKTVLDLGSIYSNSGSQYVLAEVLDSNTIFLIDTTSNSDNYPSSGVFTYVSGGNTTSDLNVSSKSLRQAYPCHKDYSMTVLVDGREQTDFSNITGYNDSVIFNESYTLLERSDVIDWYLAGKPTSEPTGQGQIIKDTSYQFDFEGNCTIVSNYTSADSVPMADIMELQAIEVPQLTEYYIPKTVEFDFKGTPRNFSLKEPSTVCTDAGGDTGIFFSGEKLEPGTIFSDRWLQIGSVGVFAMGFLPVGSAGQNRSTNVTTFTMEIRRNTNKMYPRLLDIGDFTSSLGDSWGCIAYRVVHVPHDGATATYPVRTQGDDYYFIDYHDTSDLVSIPMPDDYIGREFEVVESRNITCASTVISNQLSCLVDCVGDYGYLVIKVKK